MNKFIGIVTLLVSIQLTAQIPAGYYNTATGSGYTLKTQLHNIIDDHNDQGYSALWDLYTTSAFRDNWYENNGSLLDIYSEKPTGADSYEYTSTSDQCGNVGPEGTCYNREHLYPQGFFNEASPMKNDAHFVVPSDGKVNGQRNNYPFGKVATATWTSTNGSKLGQNLNSGYSAGYTGIVFEPIDEFKGDVARALFYVATRYEDVITSWESFDMVNGTTNQVFTNTFKNILLTWNTLDPVSPYEIAKNNEIYYNHQNNRNPFIDHPEWVTSIWGTVVGVEENSELTYHIYPNPAVDFVFIDAEVLSEKIDFEIYDLTGRLIEKGSISDAQNISVSNLNNGVYILNLFTKTAFQTQKLLIKH
jgi:endonuclease I